MWFLPLFFLFAALVSCENACSSFGMDLYNQIRDDEQTRGENILLSPMSFFSVLGLLVLGCDGNSRDEVVEAIHMSGISNIHSYLQDLTDYPSSVANVSHGVFPAEDCTLVESYEDDALQYYDAFVQSVRFPSPGTGFINSWVYNETNGDIKDFLSDLDEGTRLVLVNTIRFQHTWDVEFQEEDTRSHQFALLDEDIFKGSYGTEMMELHEEESISYGEHKWDGERFESLTLNFASDVEDSRDFGMLFLLPDDNTAKSMRTLENLVISKGGIHQILQEQLEQYDDYDKVNVKLPRFSIEWEGTIVDILSSLGIEDIFDPEKADVSKMINMTLEAAPVYVSDIYQKANMDVTETGCRAAAASAVIISATSATLKETIKDFYAHRPFLFFLFHRESSSSSSSSTTTTTVLFQGKLLVPEKTNRNIEVYIEDYMKKTNVLLVVSIFLAGGLLGCLVIICFSLAMIAAVTYLSFKKKHELEKKINEKMGYIQKQKEEDYEMQKNDVDDDSTDETTESGENEQESDETSKDI